MEQSKRKKLAGTALVLILLGLAASLVSGFAAHIPDGFEWVAFVFAGLPEPQPTFGGIWSFLGQGPLVETLTGAFGIIVALSLAFVVFKVLSCRIGRLDVTSRDEVSQ
jgi:hypothetical protein